MDTSRDRVTLTAHERRSLVVLAERTALSDPRLESVLTDISRARRLFPRRLGTLGAAFVFLAGAALMVTTFARWPGVGSVGVVVELIALRMVMVRCAPRVEAALRHRTDDGHPTPRAGGGPADR